MDPCDLDSAGFEPEIYLSKVFREATLSELVDREKAITSQIVTLDSEMQNLVYENYNKFINATDTVRSMKCDFGRIEREMQSLLEHMRTVTELSAQVSGDLSEQRQRVARLSSEDQVLGQLNCVLDLPGRLRSCIEAKQYAEAIRMYVMTRGILQQYAHLSSFKDIHAECLTCVNEVSVALRKCFADSEADSKVVAESVRLLLLLREPVGSLADAFLQHAALRLEKHLSVLRMQVGPSMTNVSEPNSGNQESVPAERSFALLEFVDDCCNSVVSNLSLAIVLYKSVFLSRDAQAVMAEYDISAQLDRSALHEQLAAFVIDFLRRFFFDLIQKRLKQDAVNFTPTAAQSASDASASAADAASNSGALDCQMLVRALDRLYRRLQALQKLLCDELEPQTPMNASASNSKQQPTFSQQIGKMIIELILEVSRDKAKTCLEFLKSTFSYSLAEIRKTLALPKSVRQPTSSEASNASGGAKASETSDSSNLAHLLTSLNRSIVSTLKRAISQLQLFIASDVTFAQIRQFVVVFSRQVVRDGVVNEFLCHILKVCDDFAESTNEKAVSAPLVLLLSRLALGFAQSTVDQIVRTCDEQLQLAQQAGAAQQRATSSSVANNEMLDQLKAAFREMADKLLVSYVRLQSNTLSLMVRKSVDSRDWLTSVEPKQVRAVMKRLVEDLVQTDSHVGMLYEEGVRKNRSSSGGGSSRLSSRRLARHVVASSNPSASLTGSSRGIGTQFREANVASEQNFISNWHNKLFADRVDYFGPIDFTKLSVLTTIIKVTLKTLLECVRLKTFSSFGLQQIQIDTGYLQLYLWRFVNDENVLQMLIDEILASALQRCVLPSLMDFSLVERICEQS